MLFIVMVPLEHKRLVDLVVTVQLARCCAEEWMFILTLMNYPLMIIRVETFLVMNDTLLCQKCMWACSLLYHQIAIFPFYLYVIRIVFLVHVFPALC